MPCRDDWPDPSTNQHRANEIAEHATRFADYLNLQVPKYVMIAAEQPYTNISPDRLAKYLCKLIKENEDVLRTLPEVEESLQLRLWWVQHKEQDRQRQEDENMQAVLDELFESAVEKLTDEELEVLRYRIW